MEIPKEFIYQIISSVKMDLLKLANKFIVYGSIEDLEHTTIENEDEFTKESTIFERPKE